jgi:ferredoxin--NADP+ reductase
VSVPSDKFWQAEIIERRDFSHDLWAIRLKTEDKLKFQPGQYVTLGVVEDNKVVERPYSIVSSPYEDTLELFLELVPEGDLTPRLHKLKAGAPLVMRKVAKGRFTLDLKSGRKNHFLLATVTGLAPYASMVRTFYRDWKEGRLPEGLRLVCIQGASRSWELGYREEMEKAAAEVPWLTYIPTVSRPWEDAEWRGEVGRVEDVIRKYCDALELDPDGSVAYLCGHPEMIEKGKGILQRRGFAKEWLREEQYWVQK